MLSSHLSLKALLHQEGGMKWLGVLGLVALSECLVT